MSMSENPQRTSPSNTPHGRLFLRDRLPQAFSFSQTDKIIILCLAVIFIALLIYLLRTGDQLFLAYLTFCALLTMLFVGILRATGIIRTSWMVIGGSAAVYLALYWFPKDEFWKYQTRQERQPVAELRKENEQLRSEIAGADPAKSALNSYFAALQKRQYADAYAVVSKARLEEREREFGPKHFEQYQSTFTNTLGYDNIAIALVSTSSVGRKYAVS